MAEVLRAPKGLDGVAVADTTIGKSDADGTLIYRGYEIKDLFEHSTFQESTYLILYGKLPTRSELEEFEAKMRRYSMVPNNVYDLVKTIPREAHQMDVLRTAVSGLGATEGGISSEEQKLSILAQMLTVRLHLDVCGAGNGPLQVMPGSHKSGRLNAKEIADWRDRCRAVACIVPRGGALLMRPLLLHASSPAAEPSHRRVVHLEFAAESLPAGLEWAT